MARQRSQVNWERARGSRCICLSREQGDLHQVLIQRPRNSDDEDTWVKVCLAPAMALPLLLEKIKLHGCAAVSRRPVIAIQEEGVFAIRIARDGYAGESTGWISWVSTPVVSTPPKEKSEEYEICISLSWVMDSDRDRGIETVQRGVLCAELDLNRRCPRRSQ